jgi:hypothetical protein
MASRTALSLFALWLLAATGFTAAGGLTWFDPPFPQVILVALTAALFIVYALHRDFRSWADGVPTAWILAFHSVRFVGVYFLVLHGRGRLPWDFAVLGGWGDSLVAAAGLVILTAHRGSPPVRASGLQPWNPVGLVDIAAVVAFAARNALSDPASMNPLLELPLGLLPTFVVPLIVFSHGLLIVRALRSPGRSHSPRLDTPTGRRTPTPT